MDQTHFQILRSIFKPWYVKAGAGVATIFALINGYAGVEDQFPSLPKLQDVMPVTHFGFMPWWGWMLIWLLILLAIFVYGLFEYVRKVVMPRVFAQQDEKNKAIPTTIDELSKLRVEIGAVASNAEQALARYAALQASERTDTLRSIETSKQTLAGILGDLADIQRQIKIDAPNASTVYEAFHNLDTAVYAKVRRVEEEVTKSSESIRPLTLDILVLLDWAINRTTVEVLTALLGEKPIADKMSPPNDADARAALIVSLEGWITKISSQSNDAAYGREIYRMLGQTRHDADTTVRAIPPVERPSEIDVVDFIDYFVVAHRCDAMGEYLEYVIRELDRNDRYLLNRFRGQLSAHQKAQ